jgi:protein-disulfide isomerase
MTPETRSSLLVTVLPGLVLAALAFLAGCSVQGGENGITREQGDAILTELREIRRILAEQPKAKADAAEAPGGVAISDVSRPTLGADDAKVTLVEYTDYQCPFCKRFHDKTWPELKSKYVDTGKVRYEVRDMPLSFHEKAMPAAIASRCAGEQGQFWPVHETLFNAQDSLSPAMIRKTALGAGVVAATFDACVANPATKAAVEADIAEAEKIGVTGTPGFVIATKKGGKLDGTLLLGAQPAAAFVARLDALLGPAPPPAP